MLSKTIEMTITIPRKIKRKMDAVGESKDWSGVAATAFETEAKRVAADRKLMKAMEAMIQRAEREQQELRRRKRDESYGKGYNRGYRWAFFCGEARGLEALEDLRNNCESEGEWNDQFQTDPEAPHSAHERLAIVLHPEWSEKDDWDLAGEWWLNMDDDVIYAVGSSDIMKATKANYLRGFAEGALAAWSEIQERIEYRSETA